MASHSMLKPINGLMVGTGEYTTGVVANTQSKSDKKLGVVALCLFDLRRRGLIAELSMSGRSGEKYPVVREHFAKNIASEYKDMDVEFRSYPADDEVDSKAYLKALDDLEPGSIVTVFTPDDTHFEIALAAVERGMHVLVTKPAVKSLAHHQRLMDEAKKRNLLVMVEVHKRFDVMYADACIRIRSELGAFSFFQSYMSQPKFQLQTFSAWAGSKTSDISYYLNSHHIDFHVWALQQKAVPLQVTAMASTGVAKREPYNADTEDTITLLVQWQDVATGDLGTATYTSSWIAPPSDVHSQQRFFYMGQKGSITIDQAHRGYMLATDQKGLVSMNPLYMKYTKDVRGHFAGQQGYGYQSIEAFVRAAQEMNAGLCTLEECDNELATIASTVFVTAILEAGRLSLDEKRTVQLVHAQDGSVSLQ
eukprot:CAMPEP_0174236774 /NCGR_PEP_ID=MMETSP0417-20130205/5798_1 /TAXON_ID=242541 /ORGANISM="Mayorella sp, Strain BSH-02190019" /LENGTH=420 /DNA_ID=CAMNT_0015315463 /DNA_START=26 /DNA_END=1288 /DNA_ORIENTATION=+